MKMKLVACAMLALTWYGCDKENNENNNGKDVNTTDRDFVVMASVSNTAEIDAGRLTADKAEDEGIREYGAMMVADHTTVQAELKSIAATLGLNAPDSLDPKHVALKNQLMSLTGRAFDSVYIHSQVEDHQAAIALFSNESQNGRNPSLKSYASRHLPHLQLHLQKADSLARQY